jgi:hypothetical protein
MYFSNSGHTCNNSVIKSQLELHNSKNYAIGHSGKNIKLSTIHL